MGIIDNLIDTRNYVLKTIEDLREGISSESVDTNKMLNLSEYLSLLLDFEESLECATFSDEELHSHTVRLNYKLSVYFPEKFHWYYKKDSSLDFEVVKDKDFKPYFKICDSIIKACNVMLGYF